jgi:hypothetical protein
VSGLDAGVLLPNGEKYIARPRPETLECKKCGAAQDRHKPLFGGKCYCVECGEIRESI